GNLVPDPVKFPNGISGVATYVHSLGLKLGIETGVDFFKIVDAAEDVVLPTMPEECRLDRMALLMGYAGVYSSFLKHAYRQAERYQVSGAEILVEAGRRKLVGGQEDQLADIAIKLAQR
ncbi:hypothetical protein ACFQ1S_29825, partial [Kibdelosporangium lantanae]